MSFRHPWVQALLHPFLPFLSSTICHGRNVFLYSSDPNPRLTWGPNSPLNYLRGRRLEKHHIQFGYTTCPFFERGIHMAVKWISRCQEGWAPSSLSTFPSVYSSSTHPAHLSMEALSLALSTDNILLIVSGSSNHKALWRVCVKAFI